MKETSAIFKSIWYTFLSLSGISFFIRVMIPGFERCINQYESIEIWLKGFNIIKASLLVFVFLFYTFLIISFIIKALYNLFLIFYYLLFFDDSYTKVQVNIDENDMIRDSYLEFRNGDKIPLYITKIVGKPSKTVVDNNKGE